MHGCGGEQRIAAVTLSQMDLDHIRSPVKEWRDSEMSQCGWKVGKRLLDSSILPVKKY